MPTHYKVLFGLQFLFTINLIRMRRDFIEKHNEKARIQQRINSSDQNSSPVSKLQK